MCQTAFFVVHREYIQNTILTASTCAYSKFGESPTYSTILTGSTHTRIKPQNMKYVILFILWSCFGENSLLVLPLLLLSPTQSLGMRWVVCCLLGTKEFICMDNKTYRLFPEFCHASIKFSEFPWLSLGTKFYLFFLTV